MQKASVGHGKSKKDKTVKRRGLPCVRHSRSLLRVRVVRGEVTTLMKKKKGDVEAKKKQSEG
jgi:hypothetical protein